MPAPQQSAEPKNQPSESDTPNNPDNPTKVSPNSVPVEAPFTTTIHSHQIEAAPSTSVVNVNGQPVTHGADPNHDF